MPESRRRRQYKKPPSEFGSVKNIRVNLGNERQAERKKRRTQDFEENRKIAALSPCSSVTSQNDELRTKLLGSKEKKIKKKKAQESQKKPPFVVGIVHHHLYSPVSTTNFALMRKKKTDASARNNSNIKKGITKATEKRLLAKAANVETKQKPSTETLAKKPSMNGKVKVNEQTSFAPRNHKFNPPAGLSSILIESSIENNISACDNLMETAVQLSVGGNSGSIEAITLKLSFNEEETSDCLPNERTNSTGRLKLNSSAKTPPLGFSLHTEIKRQNSPHKLISIPEHSIHSKVNRRKQDNDCKISGMSDPPDKLAEKDDKMKNSDGSTEEKKYSVEYFKRVLDEERNNLEELCKKWAKVQSQGGITEDVHYRINQTIGQTNMLIKAKFKQFQGLIEDCKRKDGNVLVTCMDLHGFWDMMYIEVKDCVSRFAKLEELRNSSWQEDQSFPVKSTKSIKKKIVTKNDVSAKQNPSLILSDKKEEMAEIQDTKNNSQEMINVNNECVTPHMTNKRAVNRKRSAPSHSKRFFGTPTIPVHTSTPYPTDVRSNISNQLNPSLVTLKVNQLYNKSITLLNDTLSMTPKLTPRKNLVKKSESLKEESLRKRLVRKKADSLLDDHPVTTNSSQEKLEISQTSGDSSKKINKSELNPIEGISTEGSSDSGIDGSNQTVIEKSTKKVNHILKSSSRSIDSIKTLAKNKRSVKEPPSNKNLERKSLERSSWHPFLNKIAKSFYGTSSTVNSCPTSRKASPIHIARNISSKKTPNTDRTSRQCNSSMKRSWDKTIISDSISNVSRKIETRSSNKENTN